MTRYLIALILLSAVTVAALVALTGAACTASEPAPSGPAALVPAMIDWSRTRAWAEGGYYARDAAARALLELVDQ